MMISIDYDWIRLGIVILCFASFNTEARIDYHNAGKNSIFSKNIVKDAKVPASTFLLDWDQLKSASVTRDQLFRMQRHTYMLSPFTYNHYNGAGKSNFQHKFNLFNPFTPRPKQLTPKSVEKIPNPIPSPSFASTPVDATVDAIINLLSTSNNKVTENKIKNQKLQLQKKTKKALKIKSPKMLPRKVEPFFPSLPESKPEVRSDALLHSPFYQRKTIPTGSSAIDDINNNLSSRFKVYQAVPDDDF